jgi:hypothetical protein
MPNIVQQALGPRRQRQLVSISQMVAEHRANSLQQLSGRWTTPNTGSAPLQQQPRTL